VDIDGGLTIGLGDDRSAGQKESASNDSDCFYVLARNGREGRSGKAASERPPQNGAFAGAVGLWPTADKPLPKMITLPPIGEKRPTL
jgi:hypothetical protein